ncbi:MAG: hypothetical protein GY717_15420, partial [Rhodobacteraceae bacterium]|nr:hypothetical protein [Paracoccaceae bacterium]
SNLVNNGLFNIGDGILSLSGDSSTGGSFGIAAGASLNLVGGTHTVSTIAPFTPTSAGTLRVNGGALNVTSGDASLPAAMVLAFDAGIIGGTGKLTVNGVMNWASGDIAVNNLVTTGQANLNSGGVKSVSGRWTNEGLADWNDGALQINGTGAVMANVGTLNAVTGNTANTISGAGTFDNMGTFSKASANTLTIGSDGLLNTGDLQLSVGDIAVTPSFANQGNINVGTGSTFTVNGSDFENIGTITLADGSTLAATGNSFVNQAGGVIAGTGSIQAPASGLENFGTIEPGQSPGLLTVLGDLFLQLGGVLHIELGGIADGERDRLHVTGNASLGGTLDVDEVAGFNTSVGDSFTVMTWGAKAGAFDEVRASAGDTFGLPVERADSV